jgi:DNA-binding CsgD family transcriptional regulator
MTAALIITTFLRNRYQNRTAAQGFHAARDILNSQAAPSRVSFGQYRGVTLDVTVAELTGSKQRRPSEEPHNRRPRPGPSFDQSDDIGPREDFAAFYHYAYPWLISRLRPAQEGPPDVRLGSGSRSGWHRLRGRPRPRDSRPGHRGAEHQQLTEQQQRALLAHHYAQMPLAEIASWMGISQRTVRTHLERAEEKLRQDLRRGSR